MKLKLFIILLLLMFVAAGCGSDRTNKSKQTTNEEETAPLPNAEDDESSDETYFEPMTNLPKDEDTNNIPPEMVLITQDIFEKTFEGSYVLNESYAKSNVNFSTTLSEAADQGSISIGASGFAEEILSSDGYTTLTVYDPLRTKLVFNKYHHTHPCFGDVEISGSVECYFKGTLNNAFGNMLAKGTCVSGEFLSPGNISYTYNELTYRASFTLNVYVDGGPSDLDSYVFSGSYAFDGKMGDVQTILGMEPECKSID